MTDYLALVRRLEDRQGEQGTQSNHALREEAALALRSLLAERDAAREFPLSHKHNCQIRYDYYDRRKVEQPCSCGLDAFLKERT